MPNHITNRIKLSGEDADVHKLMEEIKNDEFGLGTIDFEKVISMPDNIYRDPLGSAEEKLYGKNNWYDCYVKLCITVVMRRQIKCKV